VITAKRTTVVKQLSKCSELPSGSYGVRGEMRRFWSIDCRRKNVEPEEDAVVGEDMARRGV
jgi:hypothetical protein